MLIVERLQSLAEGGQEECEGDPELRHVVTYRHEMALISLLLSHLGCSGHTDQLHNIINSSNNTSCCVQQQLQHRLQSTAPSTVHIYPIYLRNSWSASRNALKERPIKKYPISEMQHSTSKPQVCVLGREQHVYLFTTALALKR